MILAFAIFLLHKCVVQFEVVPHFNLLISIKDANGKNILSLYRKQKSVFLLHLKGKKNVI